MYCYYYLLLTRPEMARDASSATGEPSQPARPYSTWGDIGSGGGDGVRGLGSGASPGIPAGQHLRCAQQGWGWA